MGPDFFGNSCSNTLRSSCSQLKWPLMRQKQQNIQSMLLFRDVWIHTKTSSHDTEHFLLKPPHFSFPVTISSPLFFHHFSPPLLSFLSPSPTERKTAETACHPGNPAWSPEQLSNISLKLSLLLSLSLNLPPPPPYTQPLWPLSGQSWGVCSPQAHETNLHITELALGDYDCKADIALLDWQQCVSQPCKCHRAEASLTWHQWVHEMKQKRDKTKAMLACM